MAVSKKRETKAYKVPRNIGKTKSENPRWLVPTIVTLLIIGPAWIIVFYVTSGKYPLQLAEPNLNLVIGFVFLIAAMALLTRWK